MSKYFNLLDERWLPVCMTNGSLRDVGLLELFEQAGQIRALTETSPPSVIAIYRLLLAIAHRALSRLPSGWKDRDRAEWYSHGLPLEAIARISGAMARALLAISSRVPIHAGCGIGNGESDPRQTKALGANFSGKRQWCRPRCIRSFLRFTADSYRTGTGVATLCSDFFNMFQVGSSKSSVLPTKPDR